MTESVNPQASQGYLRGCCISINAAVPLTVIYGGLVGNAPSIILISDKLHCLGVILSCRLWAFWNLSLIGCSCLLSVLRWPIRWSWSRGSLLIGWGWSRSRWSGFRFCTEWRQQKRPNTRPSAISVKSSPLWASGTHTHTYTNDLLTVHFED